jgi:hypothetical protein
MADLTTETPRVRSHTYLYVVLPFMEFVAKPNRLRTTGNRLSSSASRHPLIPFARVTLLPCGRAAASVVKPDRLPTTPFNRG